MSLATDQGAPRVPSAATVNPRILSSGDTALVVEFGSVIDRRLSGLVLTLDGRLAAARLPGVVETVPTMRSLMVHFDPLVTSQAALSAEIKHLLRGLEASEPVGRRWTLPVCYDPEFGPDIEDVAERTKLAPDEVVRLHASVSYRVYMIGFLPGHPYMGDIPEALRLPRRESPRVAVPPGSVSIATTMTAIYPLESPGGWHLLGRTPLPIFDVTKPSPSLLAPADEVRFRRIERAEYEDLAARAATGQLALNPDPD